MLVYLCLTIIFGTLVAEQGWAWVEDAEGHEQANEALDVVEAIKVCHTNSRNAISDAAKEAFKFVSPLYMHIWDFLWYNPSFYCNPSFHSLLEFLGVYGSYYCLVFRLFPGSSRSRSRVQYALCIELATGKNDAVVLQEQMEELNKEN